MQTIILIDDQYFISKSLTKFLEQQGYKVLSGKNAYIGIKLVIQNKPDVLIVDLMMPGMNGFETIEYLLKKKFITPNKILILTAKKDAESIKKACQYGIKNYMIKPFNYKNLLLKIKKIILKTERKIENQNINNTLKVEKYFNIKEDASKKIVEQIKSIEQLKKGIKNEGHNISKFES